MKTITIDIIKKNRKYFACKISGYKAKLIIDDNSKDLELGKQELMVNDKSIRSKYGTDIIYELASDAESQKNAGIVSLEHFKYNQYLVDQCRNLGGRWDDEKKVWIFSDIVEDKIDELDYIFNSELISIEIKAKDLISIWHGPVDFCGYTIAKAWGRDSGAILGDGVSMIDGSYDSGGSMKNWVTKVNKGSIFRLKVPRLVIENYYNKDGDWDIKELFHVKH